MRWMLLLTLVIAAGCGDDPDVYSLDGSGGSGGSGGATQDSPSDASSDGD